MYWVISDNLLTFGSREEQVIGGIYAQNRLGVSLRYIDTLKFGCAAGFRRHHRIDHTSITDYYSKIKKKKQILV